MRRIGAGRSCPPSEGGEFQINGLACQSEENIKGTDMFFAERLF